MSDILGQYDKALEEGLQAFRLDSESGQAYSNLVYDYLVLNRPEEARATAQEAQTKSLDSSSLRWYLYQLAVYEKDAAEMARQVAWLAGKAGNEGWVSTIEADAAAYSGRLEKAREFSRQAVVAWAVRADEKESAANVEAQAALREALFGNASEARQRAAAALRLSTGRDVQYGAALALAFAGATVEAQILADDLAKRFPEDTIVRYNYLPTIHAQVALSRKDAAKAIEALRAVAPYELGSPAVIPTTSLYPVYVRGITYLAGRQEEGRQATAEFQKILDHRGVVLNEPIGALAHLGLARAYVLQGDEDKAHAAYRDFFKLWKDADPDIPILKEAKAEYTKLQ